MFNPETITQEPGGGFSCAVSCQSSFRAEELRAGFTGPVRQISLFADLYCDKNRLILEAADRKTLLRLLKLLNHAIEQF